MGRVGRVGGVGPLRVMMEEPIQSSMLSTKIPSLHTTLSTATRGGRVAHLRLGHVGHHHDGQPPEVAWWRMRGMTAPRQRARGGAGSVGAQRRHGVYERFRRGESIELRCDRLGGRHFTLPQQLHHLHCGQRPEPHIAKALPLASTNQGNEPEHRARRNRKGHELAHSQATKITSTQYSYLAGTIPCRGR